MYLSHALDLLQSRLGADDLLHFCSVCTVISLGYLSGRERPQLLNQMCTKWQMNTVGGFIHDKRVNHPEWTKPSQISCLGFSTNTVVAIHHSVQAQWFSVTLDTLYEFVFCQVFIKRHAAQACK